MNTGYTICWDNETHLHLFRLNESAEIEIKSGREQFLKKKSENNEEAHLFPEINTWGNHRTNMVKTEKKTNIKNAR